MGGFDLARALAIAGMVLVNFRHSMFIEEAGPAPLRELATLVDGRAAALFVILAGVGLSLMGRRARLTGDAALLGKARRALYVRGAILFVAGLLHLWVWPADILHFYGLFLPMGALLLVVRGRALWGAIGVATAGFLVLYGLLDYTAGWKDGVLAEGTIWTLEGFVRDLFYSGFHPIFPWAGFLFYGMWLGRLDLTAADVRRRALVWGLTVMAAAETLAHVGPMLGLGEVWDEWLFNAAPTPPTPLFLLAAGGAATAALALCTTASMRLPKKWLEPLLRTGQMALTLYITHVIIGLELLGVLEGWVGSSMWTTLDAVAIFMIFAIIWSHLWVGKFGRGPLEQLMRRVVAHPRFRT